MNYNQLLPGSASLPCCAILLSPITIVILPHWDKLSRATSSSTGNHFFHHRFTNETVVKESFSGQQRSLFLRIMVGQKPGFTFLFFFFSPFPVRRLHLAGDVFIYILERYVLAFSHVKTRQDRSVFLPILILHPSSFKNKIPKEVWFRWYSFLINLYSECTIWKSTYVSELVETKDIQDLYHSLFNYCFKNILVTSKMDVWSAEQSSMYRF